MEKSLIAIVAFAVAAALLVGAPAALRAQEDNDGNFWADDEKRPPSPRFELTAERIEHLMERLKDAEPAKARHLEQLRRDDPKAFEAEIRELMRQRIARRIRAGTGQDERRGRFMRRPEHKRPGPPGARRGPRMPSDAFIKWLEENYPEEAERIKDLKQTNLELFRTRAALLRQRYGRAFRAAQDNPELAEILKQDLELTRRRNRLLRQIRAAGPDERAELMRELTEVVSRRYDLILERKQIEIQQLLERLARLQAEVNNSRAQLENWKDPDSKNSNVEKRVDELVGATTDEFQWDSSPPQWDSSPRADER